MASNPTPKMLEQIAGLMQRDPFPVGSTPLNLPPPHWVDLRLPDGTHSGVRIDVPRGLLEVQKRSGRHIFDLTALQPIEDAEQLCYTESIDGTGSGSGEPTGHRSRVGARS